MQIVISVTGKFCLNN